MSNKKIRIVAFCLLLVLFYIQAALAFTFTSDKEAVSLCPRDTQLFVDKIVNDNKLNEFTINSVGAASVWSTSVPNGLILKSNEEGLIYTYVTPKLDTYPADYELIIKASSQGIVKEVKHKITVKDCHILNVNVNENLRYACPNDIVKYEFTIKNNGEYQESYELSVSGAAAEWTTLSENNIILNKGEMKTVYAYVKADKNALGDYEFALNVRSKVSKAVESAKAKLNVKPCYDFNSNTKNNFANFCEHTIQTLPLLIENKGTVDNTYKLSVSGPLWANLDKTDVNLKPGANQQINLILSPDYKIEGDFKIDVTTLPVKGFTKSINSYNAHVRKCHSIKVSLQDSDKMCNLVENNYALTIKNNGEYKKDLKVEMNAPPWITINSNGSLSLDPNQSKVYNINAKPGYNVDAGDNLVKVKVSSVDDSKLEENAQLNVVIVSRKECYLPKIIVDNKNLDVYYDSSLSVPITIENKGQYAATYEITLGGSASSFISLNPSTVRLDSGKSSIVYAYVAPSAQIANGDYLATVGVRLIDSTVLATETLNIKISDVETNATKINGIKQISFWDRVIGQVKNGYDYLKTKVAILNKAEEENAVNESVANTNSVKNSTTKEIASKALNKAWLYKNYILLGVILLLVTVIVLNLTLFRKKRRKRNGRR